VRLDKAGHQKSVDPIELPLEARGEAPRTERSGEAHVGGARTGALRTQDLSPR